MKYRNIKNGSVIDIPCILTDVNWEALEPSNPQSDKEPQEVKEQQEIVEQNIPEKVQKEETAPKKTTRRPPKKGRTK